MPDHLAKNFEQEKNLAKRFDMKISENLAGFKFVREKTKKIPYLFAKHKGVLPLEEKDGKILVAISDPLNIESLEEIRLLLKKETESIFCPKPILDDAIEQCYRQKEGETQKLFSDFQTESYSSAKENQIEGYDLLEKGSENPVIQMLNSILVEAIQLGSSDIHFEPGEEGLIIRYRVDGMLSKRHVPPLELQTQMLTRIKVMAKLDITEHRLPQDGRIKLKMGGREIDFRVSTIPAVHGERIVLRILDRGNITLGLDKIGMDEELLKAFRKLISFPEGIILVTGPTGSGKTTTLYSAVMEINSPEKNIMTIEDPVEYKLPSIAQMNINPKIGLSFAKGLRHILRQDPDVIMIGEIRDHETAEIAIQASLTGHLVFSTLHTNDAPSAITRLADMGIEPYLLSSSIIGVIAQRLVRKICQGCKSSYIPAKEELRELNLKEEDLIEGKLFQGRGCDLCFGTGYKGRHGIYEYILITSRLKKQILKSVDAEHLKKAEPEHQMDLYRNGSQLVKSGITTSAEFLRIVRMPKDESEIL